MSENDEDSNIAGEVAEMENEELHQQPEVSVYDSDNESNPLGLMPRSFFQEHTGRLDVLEASDLASYDMIHALGKRVSLLEKKFEFVYGTATKLNHNMQVLTTRQASARVRANEHRWTLETYFNTMAHMAGDVSLLKQRIQRVEHQTPGNPYGNAVIDAAIGGLHPRLNEVEKLNGRLQERMLEMETKYSNQFNRQAGKVYIKLFIRENKNKMLMTIGGILAMITGWICYWSVVNFVTDIYRE